MQGFANGPGEIFLDNPSRAGRDRNDHNPPRAVLSGGGALPAARRDGRKGTYPVRWTIGGKLAIGFAGVLALIASVMYVGFSGFDTISAAYEAEIARITATTGGAVDIDRKSTRLHFSHV